MMKSLLLVSSLILANSALVSAAPAQTVRWEYAFVEAEVRRATPRASTPYQDGVELRFQKKTLVFLPYTLRGDLGAFLLDIFSRLGDQGWELVTSPGYAGATKYIFKRRK